MIRFLSESDVSQALDGVDLLQLMHDALCAFSSRTVEQPTRTVLSVGARQAYFGVMPAYLPQQDALGTKLVSVFTSNLDRGIPTHAAVVLLFDAATGELAAVLDGRYITEVRTAAVSAVAARALAAHPPRRLAVLGCGVQAGSHVRALAAACPSLTAIDVWSPSPDLAGFVEATRAHLAVPIGAASGAEAAVRAADLVVLVTASPEPVVSHAWVAPGTVVISVGACRPTHREMDPALVAAARVFVDSMDAALIESGDIVQGIAEGRFGRAHVRGELGDVLLGRVAARESAREIVVFKSLGLAVEDVIVADAACRRAVELGLGTPLSF